MKYTEYIFEEMFNEKCVHACRNACIIIGTCLHKCSIRAVENFLWDDLKWCWWDEDVDGNPPLRSFPQLL